MSRPLLWGGLAALLLGLAALTAAGLLDRTAVDLLAATVLLGGGALAWEGLGRGRARPRRARVALGTLGVVALIRAEGAGGLLS